MTIEAGNIIAKLRRQTDLSQRALARQLSIPPATLCMIESGKQALKADMLRKLARQFQVSTDYILGLHPDPGSAPIEYAGVRRIHLDNRDLTPSVEEATRNIIDALLALETLCSVEKTASIPLQLPLELTNMPRLAADMRNVMQMGDCCVFDYFELFESFGLRVISLPLYNTCWSCSFYDRENENAFFFINNKHTAEKQLFQLAYELGLMLLSNWADRRGGYPARGTLSTGSAQTKNNTAPPQLDPKHVAAKFAAAFLLPASTVRRSVHQLGIAPDQWTYDLLLRIKHRFGLSAQAFLYRLTELQLIDDPLAKQLRDTIHQHYQENGYTEPSDSRRILSPNGRIGDLISIAQRLHSKHPALPSIQQTLTDNEITCP